MKNFKLRHKIIIFSVLIIVTLSLALSLVLLFRANAVIRGEFQERALSVIGNFSQEAELAVLVENRKLLSRQVEELLNVKDFAYIRVYNQQGEVLAARSIPPVRDLRDIFKVTLPVVVSPEGGTGNLPEITGTGQRVALRSDSSSPEVIGRVEAGFTTGTMRDTIYKITFRVVMVTLVFIAVGIIVSYFFSTSITRPIGKLVTATKQVARGDLDYRIEIQPGDEIGELADSFNRMTGNLKLNLDKLADLTDGLERKVKERTLELEQANKKLKESNIRITEADRMKSQFVARMSHELRTPLNAILGFSGIMLEGIEGELTDNVKQDLGIINSSGKHLLALINNMLDLAKIEAGKMELHREKVDIGKIIDEALEGVTALVGNRKIEIQKEIGEIPRVWADQTKILQVMLNLLSNSVKFTEKGTITVRAACRNGDLLVSVSDTGIGIREESKRKVFEEFNRLQGSSPGTTGGAGLGLVITKKLVEMHGGRVEMASTFGRGSTFSFTLPVGEKGGPEDA
jgi:signal transduction histidine kinase